jgi:hypothetical protein
VAALQEHQGAALKHTITERKVRQVLEAEDTTSFEALRA